MNGPNRVALVDDHRFLVQSLVLALRAEGHDALAVDTDGDVLAQVEDWHPSVVVLDLQLENGVRGDDLIAALATHDRLVVVLTAENDLARWGACLMRGAHGVIAKTAPLEDVVSAVSAAARGLPVVSEADRMAWLRANDHARREAEKSNVPFRRLTPREQEVLAALVDGQPAAVIADRAVVSEATVRSQIRAVLRKLGVASQLQAVAKARRAGWSGPAR
jgi:DNA-binding NarL/FixJ family response regulator